jgi:hypothetical protein
MPADDTLVAYLPNQGVLVTFLPPTWNFAWAFPGPPFPPGYSPSYSMSLVADATYAPGGFTSSVVASMLDGGYATSAPTGNATLSAKMDGVTIGIRIH